MFASVVAVVAMIGSPQADHSAAFKQFSDRGLTDLGAYSMLHELCTKIGHRLSGSPSSLRAIDWTEAQMKRIGLMNIQRIPCMVPRWVRGKETASMVGSGKLAISALGGSIGTPSRGITAEVVEVKSLQEVADLGAKLKGKIVFYNRPFDRTVVRTGTAYGQANDQRTRGASAAAKVGAVGVLVRSLTFATDDVPHTGALRYEPGFEVPAAALGIQSADRLSAAIKQGPVQVRLTLGCKNLPEVESFSVMGDLRGSEHPGDIIVVGGHLDSWDVGQGAHDDGAGVVHALEAARLIQVSGRKPKRTIRVVAFMNEENGLRGGLSYAERAKTSPERSYAAIESDSGGFMPRGFSVTESKLAHVQAWLPLFQGTGVERFVAGGGGADIGPLGPLGTTLFGLIPEDQRYFDYHHAATDTIDKVNARELEFGAIAMAGLAWMISEEGLPQS